MIYFHFPLQIKPPIIRFGRLIIISMSKKEQQLQTKIRRLIEAIQVNQQKALQTTMAELKQTATHSQLNEEPLQKLYAQVQKVSPLQKIARYRKLKEKLFNNNDVIRVAKSGQAVTSSMEALIKDSNNDLEQSFRIFTRVLQSLNQFEQLALEVGSGINLAALRQQLYPQLLGRVIKAIQSSDQSAERFLKVIVANSLPLKKDQVRKDGLGEEDRKILLACLYRQTCLFSLRQYLQGLLEMETKSNQDSLLEQYWESTHKVVNYLFINHSELRNLEEPGWMFEYLQHVLNVNYKFLLDFVCPRGVARQEVATTVTHHFLSASYITFMQPLIENRFREDLPNLNDFFLFHFLDQLGKYEQKLAASFGQRPSFVDSLLKQFDGSHQVLQRCLEYEQKWFQSKIFQDFVNIDYSHVNLKNLDAYNIVVNFLSLFQRLQRKFVNVTHPSLRQQASTFYEKQVLQVVAHVKTSFDRIYNHSRLPKIDVLLSFKRIENDMKASLSGLLQSQPHLEDSIQREFHNFLEQYFEVCALEAVTPTHKKLHISLGEVMGYLCGEDEQDHQKYLSAFGKIFLEWATKIEQIGKFASYTDLKVRAIFFKYLEATSFSSVGLNLYLKIFEPYLRLLLSEDRHRTLLSMISMRRDAFKQYIESHTDSLTFVSPEERKQLQAFKRTVTFE